MSTQGWIGVDLDGTLAHYDGWKGADHIGEPVPAMVERVKRWLAEGKTVKIMTARVYCPPEPSTRLFNVDGGSLPDGSEWKAWRARKEEADAAEVAIQGWCIRVFGHTLPVTCTKDYGMIELWDDRAVRVVINNGEPCCK